MRIRRIKMRNYAGVTDAEVTFPSDGITVVEGVNEAGKTTLIRALDAILDSKDSSKSREVKDAVPIGTDVGPEVEVDIETGEYEFTYRKRWMRSRETILEIRKPRHEQLRGAEAHNRVKEILAETLDNDLWRAVRLDQGNALGQADFEVSALGRALDAAAGSDVAGDSEDTLWNRIGEAYAEFWTPGGSAKGNLHSVETDLEEARVAAAEATAHLHQLDDDAAEIQRLDSEAATLKEAHDEAVVVAEDLVGQAEAVLKMRQVEEQAERELERSLAVHSKVQGDRQRRNDLVEAVDAARADLDEVTEQVNRSEPEREVLAAATASAREAQAGTRSVWEDAQAVRERTRQDSEYRRQQIEIGQLTERRDRVADARELLATANDVIESVDVNDELLAEIESAHLVLAETRAAASQALPTVTIEALSSVTLTVDDDDVEMGSGDINSVTVHDLTHIVAPQVVDIQVTAGVDSAAVSQALEDAENRYAELCRRGGVSDFAEGRREADRRSEATRERVDALETIEQDLRDLTFEALASKIESLTQQTATYEGSRDSEPPVPPDHPAAQDLERAAERAVGEAKVAHERADALNEEAAASLNRFDLKDAHVRARYELAESAVVSAEQTLVDARIIESDEVLQAVEEVAVKDVEGTESAVADGKERIAAADPDALDARLTNAEAVKRRSVESLRNNEDRRRELQIRLDVETEKGPAQFADEAETELIEASARFERVASRAAAARLLYETMLARRQEARRRYNQPFSDQIETLGRIVFGPSFEIALDDDLAIESRTLDGTTLGFDRLSTGAQEQLGLLARLACAMLVSPEGGAPVIFDDALGWTDPGRLERMGAAISSAADDCQVIILTCVPNRYAGVGKARVVTI